MEYTDPDYHLHHWNVDNVKLAEMSKRIAQIWEERKKYDEPQRRDCDRIGASKYNRTGGEVYITYARTRPR